jgi:tripartite motif-containing protein 2/3
LFIVQRSFSGRFRFQFGECGKRDGQLLYPNRVAVFRQSGDIVVTERSPTHQIQIYNQYGQFIRKFGANVLQHPRGKCQRLSINNDEHRYCQGVCVDNMGHIIVVECKVMRVYIFDINGNVLNKFTCSKYLEFPNGVCCNDKQEIFISDNRAHCIKVFSYDGQFLRTIGSEGRVNTNASILFIVIFHRLGVTNYPIGVVQNSQGDVLIADNHNNFNLTIFSQGKLLSHEFALDVTRCH